MRPLLPYERLLHLNVGRHLSKIGGPDILPQLPPHRFVGVHYSIETTPEQTDRLLDEVKDEGDGFCREEGVAAQDARWGDIPCGEDGHGKGRFYFAVFENDPSASVIDEILDRTPYRISRTISLPHGPVRDLNARIPAGLPQCIDARIRLCRSRREQALQHRDRVISRTRLPVRTRAAAPGRYHPRVCDVEYAHAQECCGEFLETFLYQVHFGSDGFGGAYYLAPRRVHDGAPHAVGGLVKRVGYGVVDGVKRLLRCRLRIIAVVDVAIICAVIVSLTAAVVVDELCRLRKHGYAPVILGSVSQVVLVAQRESVRPRCASWTLGFVVSIFVVVVVVVHVERYEFGHHAVPQLLRVLRLFRLRLDRYQAVIMVSIFQGDGSSVHRILLYIGVSSGTTTITNHFSSASSPPSIIIIRGRRNVPHHGQQTRYARARRAPADVLQIFDGVHAALDVLGREHDDHPNVSGLVHPHRHANGRL
mmetsp:Transcript_33909/g.82000  ORF Transcript_33909/g.82000 Transcript_33909/m.82000 type:complete len:477 (-) Transcript_33909:820-2250(-)